MTATQHSRPNPDPEVGVLALGTRPRLRIAPAEHTQKHTKAKAFHDLHAGTIEYHVVPHEPYHSYIRGDGFRIETDQSGRPVLMEVLVKKCTNGSVPMPAPRSTSGPSPFRFLDLRIKFHEVEVLYDPSRQLLFIELEGDPEGGWIDSGSPHSMWRFGVNGNLTGVIIDGITLDPTGKAKMAWRAEVWREVRELERQSGGEGQIPKAISAADLVNPA